jgi:RNA polymerase sigma factor for flagellar operon FliA
VQFETFATQRIRGAMLDELRGSDWMSRGDRASSASIEDRRAQARAEAGPRAQRERDRQGDGHALTEYQDLLGKVRGTQLIYLEDMSGDEGDDDYLDRHVADEAANPLARCRTTACAKRWSRPSRTCPSASST